MGDEGSGPPIRRDRDIVLDRDSEGVVYASLPHAVRHYGVDAFDWGYIGPATAELALNILTWILPPGVDGEAAIRCEHGECSAAAWRLHRSFMAEFLVRVPYSGGCIPEAEVRAWIVQHFDAPSLTGVAAGGRGWVSLILPRE